LKASKANHYLYNSNLKEKAKRLRNESTHAEIHLWKYGLKNRLRLGYTFNRQRPVLNYIADFMCKELLLIIEVDGMTHSYEEVYKNDLIRTEKLEAVGFMVIRFTNDEVQNHINRVNDQIDKVIKNREKELGEY